MLKSIPTGQVDHVLAHALGQQSLQGRWVRTHIKTLIFQEDNSAIDGGHCWMTLNATRKRRKRTTSQQCLMCSKQTSESWPTF